MASIRARRPSVLLVAAPLLLAVAGCVELDLHIKLKPDGSATVTETVRLSEQVLDLASTLPADKGLEILLKKDRAAERVALMGKGVTLVSHTVNTLPGGAKESVTVYAIPDVNDLLVCSPAVCYLEYETSPMTFIHGPHYTDGSGYNIGRMHVHAITRRKTKRWPRENPYGLKPPPPKASPAELQKYRDLLPVFKDLMRGFSLTVRIDCYAPVRTATRRNIKSDTHDYFVMLFNDKNLDNFGTEILDSEEFMLALIRWDLQSPHVIDVVKHCQQNLAVPVWAPYRGMVTPWQRYISLTPSAFLFNKYFKGKPTYFGGDLDVPKPKGTSFKSRDELIKWGIIKPPPKKPA